MTNGSTTSAEFFETKYIHELDPWKFATNAYEQQRYRHVLEPLSHRSYEVGFEPGCSIGVLTEGLAPLCGKVFASDFSPTAVLRCQMRCAHLTNVHIDCRELNKEGSIHGADLVVLSEIGYYFTEEHWHEIAKSIVSQMAPDGTLLAAHWVGHSVDHILSGDQVHQTLMECGGLKHELGQRFPGFRLDRWTRQP